jgi:hypothetical protein
VFIPNCFYNIALTLLAFSSNYGFRFWGAGLCSIGCCFGCYWNIRTFSITSLPFLIAGLSNIL